MNTDAYCLPKELLTEPQPLIGFCGLDIYGNQLHKTIWDAFNHKSQRANIEYKILPTNYEFPLAKSKHTTYDWYHPKGILKRNWMQKHLHALPAVVVLFQDIEWNDIQWSEKQMQCSSNLQSLRNALQKRNTRICVVLLQKQPSLPPGEDLLASERACTLANICDISSQMLFVLPYTEDITGYVIRLETAFLDMAQSYYDLIMRRICNYASQSSATSHINLKIRHLYKMGFISEILQDPVNASKYYTQCYVTLDEISINESNHLEIKTIAGFTNYKICRLKFRLKYPKNAINQFINHIDKYKNHIGGNQDLLFEHYAWLSDQYSSFAELFSETIKIGLSASQTQHPGFYFHKAAEFMHKRKEAFHNIHDANLATLNLPSVSSNKKNSIIDPEFFGIRNLKGGELQAEQQIYTIIIGNEQNFNHSMAIINLLSQAMAQFKMYKCLRFRKKLAIDMADEYFQSGDHSKALTLYTLMLPDYRRDNWPRMFSDVLLKTMQCAELNASVLHYTACCLEALSLIANGITNERTIILENLWRILKFEAPIPAITNTNTRDVTNSASTETWSEVLRKIYSPIKIDLDKLIELLQIYSTFEQPTVNNNEDIFLNVIIKLNSDVPLRISKFQVIVTDDVSNYQLNDFDLNIYNDIQQMRVKRPQYQYKEQQQQYREQSQLIESQMQSQSQSQSQYQQQQNFTLKLEPHFYYKLRFKINAEQLPEKARLRVLRCEFFLGTDKLTIVLNKSPTYTCNAFRHPTRNHDLNDNINIHPICYITPTFHLVTQCNLIYEKVLVNEYFPITMLITNPTNNNLRDVIISISVPQQLKNQERRFVEYNLISILVFLAMDATSSKQKLHTNLQIVIGNMRLQSNNTTSFFVYSLLETVINLEQKISYVMQIRKENSNTTLMVSETTTTPNGADESPADCNLPSNLMLSWPLITPVQLEYLDESQSVRKTQDTVLTIPCELDFKFYACFYTMNRKPLINKIYSGENFLLCANIEVATDYGVDIMETYFISDHNLVQTSHGWHRNQFVQTMKSGDNFLDVIGLRSNATSDNWLTCSTYESMRKNSTSGEFRFTHLNNFQKQSTTKHQTNTISQTLLSANQNKHTNNSRTSTTISKGNPSTNTNNTNSTTGSNSPITMSNGNQNPGNTMAVDNDKAVTLNGGEMEQKNANKAATRLIYNKTVDALKATGHLRGFIKALIVTNIETSDTNTNDPNNTANTTTSNINPNTNTNTNINTNTNTNTCQTHYQQEQQLLNQIAFGIYCIKWRRSGSKEENESKFVVTGLPIVEPPLNIYCTIEERMFVKMPMTYKVLLKNPTTKVLHLISTLNISNTDNFICSGHKQLDISIFAFEEKEIVYNLYPLYVGWQSLPKLHLEYNTQVDPTKDETQNQLLSELVQRYVPKMVYVLPPLKQSK